MASPTDETQLFDFVIECPPPPPQDLQNPTHQGFFSPLFSFGQLIRDQIWSRESSSAEFGPDIIGRSSSETRARNALFSTVPLGESRSAAFNLAFHRSLECSDGDVFFYQRNATSSDGRYPQRSAESRPASQSLDEAFFPDQRNATSSSGRYSQRSAESRPASHSLDEAFFRDQRNATSSNYHYTHSSMVNNLIISQSFVNSTRVERQRLTNRPRLTEIFLSLTSQAALAMLNIWIEGSTSFSLAAKILFYFAAALNVLGFVSCLFAILLHEWKAEIARIARGAGFVFAAYGFLVIMALLLNDSMMLWVAGFACAACFPALLRLFD